MSSGGKRLVLNFEERIISPDANRAQAFQSAQIAESARQLFSPSENVDVFSAQPTPATVTAPAGGAVLNGLMVVAPLGSLELAVTSGMALLIDPDGQPGSTVLTPANPDDSIGKLCYDAVGVLAGSGVLVFIPNGSGLVRVDVVEIQRDPGAVLEIDNRDIFNPGTGLFTPATVDKVAADGVVYRIRAGVPGGGVPASVLGWMPIAVVSVPSGAANFDACTLYDVRPLVSDRGPGSGALLGGPLTSRTRVGDFYVDPTTTPGALIMSGWVDGLAQGARAGGVFGGFNLRDVANQEPGFAVVASTLVAVWLLFPGGLPRWVRYSTVASPPFGGRVPNGPRGIMVLSSTLPLSTAPLPSAPVNPPPASGLVGSLTSEALLVGVLANSSTPGVAGCVAKCVDGRTTFGQAPGVGIPVLLPVVTPAAFSAAVALQYGLTVPAGVRAVLLNATCDMTGVPATPFNYQPSMGSQRFPVGNEIFVGEANTIAAQTDGAGVVQLGQTRWVDLMVDRSNIQPVLQVANVNWLQAAGVIKSADAAAVLGWEV